jgi:hypothetical protein
MRGRAKLVVYLHDAISAAETITLDTAIVAFYIVDAEDVLD